MVEKRTHTQNTGTIIQKATSMELGQRGEDYFAVIRAQTQVAGVRKMRDIWYPLRTTAELTHNVGDRVRIRYHWHTMGKGGGTTATLESIKPFK
jgi:hypothetical protein